MTTINTTTNTTTVVEGDEYRIALDGRIIYEGIAEFDGEAEERLERYMLLISATNNRTKFLRFRIINLSN